jgi:predicted RecB family nuclease
MSKSIQEIEGIGPVYQEKLANAGIKTVEALLEKGATPVGRKNISNESGLSESVILDWVNMADLFRINGVAGQFAELLKVSGVDTIKELRNRNPENLHIALVETNSYKNLTKVIPNVETISGFINQAKDLSPVITY